MSISNFYGNAEARGVLERMADSERIPQTILLHGPAGIGKATLVRRFAALLLGDADKIERDDLSLPDNQETAAERDRWTADKRTDEPLLWATHPDFVTFAPDGPLRQISIGQIRLLRTLAQHKPNQGAWRVFLIDQIDRANEQAANSLLKTLEEPPPHLILLLTAQNAYDLLATIRSRAVMLRMMRLGPEDMQAFAAARQLPDRERRIALADGSPGLALSLELDRYDALRTSMLALLQTAAGGDFSAWVKHAETVNNQRQVKLEQYANVLYLLLSDLLHLQQGQNALRNPDIRPQLAALAGTVSFPWLLEATRRVDELVRMARRNIQKSVAFDAFASGF